MERLLVELARAISAHHALDDDGLRSILDDEANAPLFHREDERILRFANAAVGVRLGPDGKRLDDARAEVTEVTPLLRGDPGELRLCIELERYCPNGRGWRSAQPTLLRVRECIRVRDVRLQIEHRRSIEHVEAA